MVSPLDMHSYFIKLTPPLIIYAILPYGGTISLSHVAIVSIFGGTPPSLDSFKFSFKCYLFFLGIYTYLNITQIHHI